MKATIGLALSAVLLCTGQAEAQFSKLIRQPTAASTEGLREQVPPEARANLQGETERVIAQSRMENLYRRLDAGANRASNSICEGCKAGRSAGTKSRRREASAEELEFPVDDPAEAPQYGRP